MKIKNNFLLTVFLFALIKAAANHFVFIIPSHNTANNVEKLLDSIFSQTYPHYHILLIDDGSTDNTYAKASAYSSDKLLLIRNEKKRGALENLYEQVHRCKDSDIIIYLRPNTRLSSKDSLASLNDLYNNGTIWMTYTDRPQRTQGFFSSFLRRKSLGLLPCKTFYAALFKKIKAKDLFFRGKCIDDNLDIAYLFPMIEMAEGHIGYLSIPTKCQNIYRNCHKAKRKCEKKIRTTSPYPPLPSLDTPDTSSVYADLLIFSYDRPMQLWAHLESLQKYVTGFNKIFVLYRTSSETFEKCYEEVQETFPNIHFIKQGANDFQKLTLDILFKRSLSPYIAFSVDDIIIKDSIDISACLNALEQTGSYLFSLRLGKNINYCYMGGFSAEAPFCLQLQENTLLWQPDAARGDWMAADSIDMNLYRKKDLEKVWKRISFQNPNELEWNWSQYPYPTISKRERIGICYTSSKVVNIPLNIVHPSQNPHMNLYSKETLLNKFRQGYRIDISPLHELKNSSVHVEYAPFFRK